MIGYQEAIGIIQGKAQCFPPETISLADALGAVAAEHVISAMHLPSFRNSAMDGFAVRIADLQRASDERPVALKIAATIAAGDVPLADADAATVEIMTGALVPQGFDAVIPVEQVKIDGNRVIFSRPAKQHENIRMPGDDVLHGQSVLKKGQRLTAERLMLLAALGVSEVKIQPAPAIHVFATGKEIIESTDGALQHGKIYNSNAPFLLARCREEGFIGNYGGIIDDDKTVFEQAIRLVPQGAIVITTGAVSKGKWDFIPESLGALGAEIHFHRVNIRPGKPILFASLPNGSYFFGLPGNPISAAIGFRFFVMPLLRALQELPPEVPLQARLIERFGKKGDFRHFLKSHLTVNSAGELQVAISGEQESFKISPMANCNGWVVAEEEHTELQAGTLIPVFPFASHFRHEHPIPILKEQHTWETA